MKKKIMNALELLSTILSILFLLWIIFSWGEVVIKNGNENPIYLPINFFVLLTEIKP